MMPTVIDVSKIATDGKNRVPFRKALKIKLKDGKAKFWLRVVALAIVVVICLVVLFFGIIRVIFLA